jgi:hypothetical protein
VQEQRDFAGEPGTEEARGAEAGGSLELPDPRHALEVVAAVAREHPHAALAGACAVGFVLGGGVTPRLLGAVALVAARRYFRQAVDEAIQVATRAMAEG